MGIAIGEFGPTGASSSTQVLFSFKSVKFLGVISDVSWDVGRGVRILIKKLIIKLVCETNLLRLINLSLAHILL
jgi:hypothetical protein